MRDGATHSDFSMAYALLTLTLLRLLLLATPFILVNGDKTKYCKICPSHTLCKFQGISSRCHDLGAIELDLVHKQEILREHNRLRGTLALGYEQRGKAPQPPASNMLKMQWDDELAKIAQIWAQQCNYGHDLCRDVERFPVGQNVGIRWTTNPENDWEWPLVIQAWYDEVTLFNPKDIEPFQFDHQIGHYTQIAWADTWLIGCANVYYKHQAKHYRYYVCNYGPGGNEISLPVDQAFPGYTFPKLYKIGLACQECPENTHCCINEPGLCCNTTTTTTTIYNPYVEKTTKEISVQKNKIIIINNNTIPFQFYYPSTPPTTTTTTTTSSKKVFNFVFSFYTTKKPIIPTTTTKRAYDWQYSTTPYPTTTTTTNTFADNRLKIWLSYFTPRSYHSTSTTTTTSPYTTTTPPPTITNKTPRTPLDIYSFFKIY